ncbi:MAG: sulfotransferase [Simkaniaceae bacterium]|nr:sulfotransferase [Simkaniaceae bacterium]
MRYFSCFFILTIFCLQNGIYAAKQVDNTSRKILLKDLLQERYFSNEIENDSPFNYIPHPRIILCSEPSSGNSWCRYALEYLSKRPSTRYFFDYQYDRKSYFSLPEKERHWFNAINPSWGIQFPDIGIDFSKAPILKHHDVTNVYQKAGLQPLIYPSKDKLILIVRDYKELYYRNSSSNRAPIESTLGNYFNLLEFYYYYPEDKKILVYYEDLLSEPNKFFSSLLEFTGDSKDYLEEFIEQIEFHSGRCASLYNIPKHAKSLGKKNFRYSNQVHRSALLKLEQEVKEKHPIIFDKYLKKYQLD